MDSILQINNVTRKEFISIIENVIEDRFITFLKTKEPENLTVQETAKLSGVTELTIHNNIKEGLIPASKIGCGIVIKHIDIENAFNEVKSLKDKAISKQSLNNSFGREQGKDEKYKAQIQIVYNAFKVKPMTMLEADLYTGVMRSNICWYIDELLEQGKIAMTKKRKCSITGRLVKEFTTDTALFPKSNQLTLF